MKLGEKLQQLRRRSGLSQEDLALQLGVTRQAVSKWETGETMPDTGNVIQLCDLFSVSADYLLRDGEERAPASSPAKEDRGQQRLHASVVGGLALCAIGLITALSWLLDRRADWLPLQGLLTQVMGVFLFELMGALYGGSRRRRLRFYAGACWLLAPIPLAALCRLVFQLAVRPHSALFLWTVFYLMYMITCVSFTVILFRMDGREGR